jgi:hypothetical protein
MVDAKRGSAEKALEGYGWRWWLPRLLAGALGIIFLASALSKATDFPLFVRQMRAYGIISNHILLNTFAWALITLEFGLGIGLLIHYRPRRMLTLTAALFLLFLGATSWASLNGAAKECGCFGAWLKRTPQEATFENLILLAASVIARLGYSHVQVHVSRIKTCTLASAFVIGTLLPLVFGFSFQHVGESRPMDMGPDVGQLEIEGVKGIDLQNTPYLLAIMDLDCGHCLELVEGLNALAKEPEIPALIGLCINDENRRKRFMEEFEPAFPIGRIGENDFWRLLADADLPRVLYVRNGRIQKAWNQTVPDKDALQSERMPQ